MTKEELAEQYADETVIAHLKESIMYAYQKGYDAAKLKYGKIIDIDVDHVKCIDLDLPSGTCWSEANSESNYGSYLKCISYEESQNLNIPTLEQWYEVMEHCKFIDADGYKKVRILGPNREQAGFKWSGTYNSYIIKDTRGQNTGCEGITIKFWLKSNPDTKHMVDVIEYDGNGWKIGKHFTGYDLPFFLVKNKSDL